MSQTSPGPSGHRPTARAVRSPARRKGYPAGAGHRPAARLRTSLPAHVAAQPARFLHLMLDGLRAGGTTELPGEPAIT
ncbi:hypothetical protein AB0J63_07490 [Streptosporangium canum]|uniref:hypothetical protein n=1 Tax=Streptosporangium canum TaxID=324952 RepID=UPI00342408B2